MALLMIVMWRHKLLILLVREQATLVIITSANTGLKMVFRLLVRTGGQRLTIPVAMDFRTALASCLQMLLLNWMVWLVTRKRNSITDLIDGASIELKSEFTEAATVGISRSEDAVRQTVQDVIFSPMSSRRR